MRGLQQLRLAADDERRVTGGLRLTMGDEFLVTGGLRRVTGGRQKIFGVRSKNSSEGNNQRAGDISGNGRGEAYRRQVTFSGRG